MSWCRFGPESDVYAFEHSDGFFAVWVTENEHYEEPDIGAFLNRLKTMKERGVKFPDWVIPDIEAEIADQPNSEGFSNEDMQVLMNAVRALGLQE